MIITLQRYLFRELLRAFALTAVALTCMLGFGGGLLDMLKGQGISAGELVKLLIYLVPVVLAYSLPVAALFSTTITYGRFSADNEFNACRASGINIHRLLFPAFVLSVLVSVVTFSLENFAIPELAKRIEDLVKRDSQGMLYHQLKHQRYISYGDFALHCGEVGDPLPPERQADGSVTPGLIPLSRVAFMQRERSIPVFYGTAETATIEFDHRLEELVVSVYLNQVRAFNERRGEMSQVGFVTMGPMTVPDFGRERIKFLPLPQLLVTIDDPSRSRTVSDELKRMLRCLRKSLVYDDVVQQLEREGQCRFEDSRYTYTLTADTYDQNPKDGRIVLLKNVAVIQRAASGGRRELRASRAMITAEDRGEEIPPEVTILLANARVSEMSESQPTDFFERDTLRLPATSAPERVLARFRNYSEEQLLDPGFELPLNDELDAKRFEAAQQKQFILSKAIGEVHSRLTYSCSSLILLVLGAALGIIFRGGHFVSAFGLSFIPMMIVVVMIMTGKQICSAGSHDIGAVVMWLGCVLVLLADVVVVGKFLKR